MFPSNLHKNIIQLDRQISLLENECKNMEVEKRKKHSKHEQMLNSKCSKISNLQMKSPPVKLTQKKSGYECSKRTKKLTPPFSTRVHSASSLQSSKPWSEVCDSLTGKYGVNPNLHVCSCKLIENANPQCDSRKENRCLKCTCYKDKSVSDVLEKGVHENYTGKFDNNKKDQVLHKEVLFSNPGGTIEVTVTKKTNNRRENSPLKKFINLGNTVEKDTDSCKCQSKGQKWSEILGVDSLKRKGVSCENSTKTQIPSDKMEGNYFPKSVETSDTQNMYLTKNYDNESQIEEHGNVDVPVKLDPLIGIVKKPTEIKNPVEKQTQCYLENNKNVEPGTQIKDPIKLFQILVNELKHKPNEEKKKLLNDMEDSIVSFPLKISRNALNGMPEGCDKYSGGDSSNQKNDLLNVMKQKYENLLKEKESLSEELSAKDNAIATMKKREEEYLSLISSLKSNLEKTKENAQDGIAAMKELNNVRSKLLEEIKITEALKKSHEKMQGAIEKHLLKNERLKTEIQIFKLESEKHNVLMAGKEAEISRYKEEIKNFQRQISDHLASLKSNSQGIDVEKMMEAIIQQSHLFIQTDSDSIVAEKDERVSSKQQNVLMHSSPTSTKNSVVNSSWKQISSIRDQDQTKENLEIVSNFNESDEKEFFQVFGGDSSDSDSSKKSKETLIEKLTKRDRDKNPGFMTCVSVQDDEDDADDALKEEIILNIENARKEFKKNKQSSQKVQQNIDNLLQNMKLKWSNEVYGTSQDDCTIEDFFNNSQISSISMNGGNPPSKET